MYFIPIFEQPLLLVIYELDKQAPNLSWKLPKLSQGLLVLAFLTNLGGGFEISEPGIYKAFEKIAVKVVLIGQKLLSGAQEKYKYG